MQKKEAEKKEKQKLIATVIEITHGRFLTKHKHYDVKIIQVPEGMKMESFEDAVDRATRVAKKIGIRTRVLAVEEVEITTKQDMKARVDKFIND